MEQKEQNIQSPSKNRIPTPVTPHEELEDLVTEKITRFMTSSKGITILASIGFLIFLISIILLNTVGSKPVLYFLFSVLGLFFIVRELIGGKRIKVQ